MTDKSEGKEARPLRLAIKCLSVLWAHKASHYAHKAEHPLHLAYFGGLSTGLLDYHMIAFGCLVIGALAMLPEGASHA